MELYLVQNRAIAEAYGINPDDFEYILTTFPVFARKRPEFFAYLQKRVAEWKEQVPKRRPSAKEYPVEEAPKAHAVAESHADYEKDAGTKKKL